MVIARKPENDDFEKEPVAAGVHHAVCYQIIDIGTQVNEMYNTSSRKILVGWELPQLRNKYENNGEQIDMPKIISKEYTLSLGEKANLRKDLETWRNKQFTEQELTGFDLDDILGANATLQIMHKISRKNNTYAQIVSITPWTGTKLSPEYNIINVDLSKNEPLPDLPEFIMKKIMASEEFEMRQHEPNHADEDIPASSYDADDDIPF